MHLVRKAEQGEQINANEIRQLLTVPLVSEEAYHVQYVARQMSSQAALAEIHGQVGVNTAACPGNCSFCSFAAVNRIFGANQVAPMEEILRQCLDLEQQGANAIYLMATANLNFAEYIEIAQEVKRHLQPNTIMVANFRDVDYSEGLALQDAGFKGIYHAVRMGEGRDTRLSVDQRLNTIKVAQEVGLLVGTCVEPIGPEHSPSLLRLAS
jgi:biotin synthase